MRASHRAEQQTVFPWNTRVLLCAGSQLYSQFDRWSLVIGNANLSFSSAVFYQMVNEVLCENSVGPFDTAQGERIRT
jgi:hypothetical protein